MEIIVFDSNDIFALSLKFDADKEVILNAYMEASGESWNNITGEPYTYSVKKHSDALYSVTQKTERDTSTHFKHLHDVANLYFIISEVDMASWWAQAYPIFERISIASGAVIGMATITYAPFKFVKWVRGKARHRKTRSDKNSEYQWIQSIICEESWNVSILSEKLSFSKEDTKKLLKGFGYVWNPRIKLYVETETTKKFRGIKKINID